MKTHEIADMIKAALREHKVSRTDLAEALVGMLAPVPNGTIIKTASHTVEMRKVFCGCSQWSNRRWDRTGSEDGYLVDGDLIRDEDPSFFDGSNHQERRTPLYLDRDGEGRALRLATAKTLRDLAEELPEALAVYISRKKADAEATSAATSALKAAK